MNALEQLSQMTTLVADTGDLEAIARLKPKDATTNPSLITKALSTPEKQSLLKETLKKHNSNVEAVIDDLTLQIGKEILTLIDGRVSTEVDARFAYDMAKTLETAQNYIETYEKMGVDRKRVLIKIPATWQGIRAAEYLEKQGIGCNLTLLFGQDQAKACADAGVTLISPFVGRILDWQKRHENQNQIPIDQDKGVQSVKNIYHYYKKHGYQTQVMGASFRTVDQILALAGCDLLTIAPDLLDALAGLDQVVKRQLDGQNLTPAPKPDPISETQFISSLTHDRITQDLLPQGIAGFVKAREDLAVRLYALAQA